MANHEQWFKRLQVVYQLMLKKLEPKGFKAIRCFPYQKELEIDGQKLLVPFSNGFHIVLLQKIREAWHLVTCWSEEEPEPFNLMATWRMIEGKKDPQSFSDHHFSYLSVVLDKGEESLKSKTDVYGEGKIMVPLTAPCTMVIGIQTRMQNAWHEVARIYPQ